MAGVGRDGASRKGDPRRLPLPRYRRALCRGRKDAGRSLRRSPTESPCEQVTGMRHRQTGGELQRTRRAPEAGRRRVPSARIWLSSAEWAPPTAAARVDPQGNLPLSPGVASDYLRVGNNRGAGPSRMRIAPRSPSARITKVYKSKSFRFVILWEWEAGDILRLQSNSIGSGTLWPIP
jgi:hypothetical protein